MRKPLIGITSSYEHNPESENAYKTSVSIDYSRAVMNAGGIPVVLPVHDMSPEAEANYSDVALKAVTYDGQI